MVFKRIGDLATVFTRITHSPPDSDQPVFTGYTARIDMGPSDEQGGRVLRQTTIDTIGRRMKYHSPDNPNCAVGTTALNAIDFMLKRYIASRRA